jgi:hypothetical protein
LTGLISAAILPFASHLQMDLHLYDTYAVVNGQIMPAFSICLSVSIWLICILLGKRLRSDRLVWVHLILTIILLLLLALSPFIYEYYFGSGFAGAPRRYYANWTLERYRSPLYFGELLLIGMFFLVVLQFIVIINWWLSHFKKV